MNWRRFFRRRAADLEQQQELQFYIDVTTEEYIERGMDPIEARAEACRKLGNTTLIREEVYQMNSIGLFEDIAREVRQAVRMMRMRPGFVLTVILSLALGIGANTAIFSVVHGVLIQPLPYPKADSLAGVYNTFTIHGQVYKDTSLSPGMYAACVKECRAFEHFGVWTSGTATITGSGEPEQVTTITATSDVLPALGVQASPGRWFSKEEDTPAGARAAILSYGYWQRKFGGDPAILGRKVVIDFIPHEVIGIMPQGFQFVRHWPDVILALRFATTRPDEFSYDGIARLRPGITPAMANEDVARVWRNWADRERVTKMIEEMAVRPNIRPLKSDVVGEAGMTLRVLMGALGLLLALVCANVANLVIVRAQARRKEFAIRAALGAGRGRMIREQLVESVTLAVMGGALGLAFAHAGIRILVASSPAGLPRVKELATGPEVVAFAALCSVAVGLLIGLTAILKLGFSPRLQGTRGATRGREQTRAQHMLVVGQVAIALVLLVGAGLMLRTLYAIHNVVPGFTGAEQIQMIRISIPDALAKAPDRVIRMQKEMLDRFAAIPGVASAGFASALPLEDNRNGVVVAVEGKTDPDRMPPNRRYRHASPGLFATLGSRLLAGRDFSWDDVLQQRRVAMVSENMARETWGEPGEAIGKRLRIGRDGPWTEVVGVVANIHSDGLHLPSPATVYARCGVETWSNGTAVVRRTVVFAIRSGRAGTEAFVKEVRDAVGAVSPNVPVAAVRTLSDVQRRSMARTSFTFTLLTIAALMTAVFVASYIPARRAASVNPADSLRSD
ncbi:MAG: ABC transporter permease [Bryobacterales bacterium]|nr:ABC transporter permease [Bryobacterales bacterium]